MSEDAEAVELIEEKSGGVGDGAERIFGVGLYPVAEVYVCGCEVGVVEIGIAQV